jgi:glycosyltransferase involved in cell wall biosynthesis
MESQNKPKITQVLYSGKGGHGSVVQYLVEGDTENQFQQQFIYFGIESLDSDYKAFCETHQIPFETILKQKGKHFSSWKLYLKSLRQQKPDFIFLHSMTLILPTIWYCWFHKAKCIAVEHQSNQAKRKSEWIWSALAVIFCSRIVYLTENYQTEVKRKIGILRYSKKSVVIANGINTDYFKPTIETEEKSIFKIGMASRINSLRDHQTLIQAFEKLNHETQIFELHIAGAGEGFEYLQHLVNQSKIKEKIKLLGNLNHVEMLTFYQSLQLYIHSSLAETQSTALLQAMAVGLPILATDINGNRELIVNKETGILFEPKNTIDLVSKIEKILQNPDLTTQLGKNARLKCENEHSSKIQFLRYAKLISKA